MKSRRIGLIFILITILLALSAAPMLFDSRRQAGGMPTVQAESEKLPDIGAVPEFALTDSEGKEWSSKTLAGKIWVADFFLTSCQGACPVMSRNMGGLHDYFKGNDKVRFVSISVDPETDKPGVIKDYAKKYEADTNRWFFLTGPIEEVHRMASEKGFKVGVPENPMAHSRRFILVDPKGHIRGYYEGMDEMSVRRCAADINDLLKEGA